MKLLTFILITLFFFAGCGGTDTPTEEGDTPPDAPASEEQQDTLEEIVVTAQRRQNSVVDDTSTSPMRTGEFSSTTFTCAGNNTSIYYEIRKAVNSCDINESSCCEVYLTDAGGSPSLISKPNLFSTRCNLIEGNISRGVISNDLIEQYQSTHVGMNCLRN